MSSSRHGLGRGLDALLPEEEATAVAEAEVPISQIRPMPGQPRQVFREHALLELAHSIRRHGILQPLVVREVPGGYELIAGERRLRAAKIAGLTTVPIRRQTAGDHDHYELALIENLQRADLDPLEESEAYHQLITTHGLTQDALARRLGKSRSRIANVLRLRGLSAEMRRAVGEGTISPGHASVLLGHQEPARAQLFSTIVGQGLSVRQAEQWRPPGDKDGAAVPRNLTIRPAWLEDLERTLATKVTRQGTDQRGKLVISYHSREQLEALLSQLTEADR